jgi:hypothetical protein
MSGHFKKFERFPWFLQSVLSWSHYMLGSLW